MTWTFF